MWRTDLGYCCHKEWRSENWKYLWRSSIHHNDRSWMLHGHRGIEHSIVHLLVYQGKSFRKKFKQWLFQSLLQVLTFQLERLKHDDNQYLFAGIDHVVAVGIVWVVGRVIWRNQASIGSREVCAALWTQRALFRWSKEQRTWSTSQVWHVDSETTQKGNGQWLKKVKEQHLSMYVSAGKGTTCAWSLRRRCTHSRITNKNAITMSKVLRGNIVIFIKNMNKISTLESSSILTAALWFDENSFNNIHRVFSQTLLVLVTCMRTSVLTLHVFHPVNLTSNLPCVRVKVLREVTLRLADWMTCSEHTQR